MATSTACSVSNHGCLRLESETSTYNTIYTCSLTDCILILDAGIYVAIVGGSVIVFGGVIIFILASVMCYKRHHRTKEPESKFCMIAINNNILDL